MTDTTTAEPSAIPLLLSVRHTTRIFGLGRSEIYRRLAAGYIIAKKLRSRRDCCGVRAAPHCEPAEQVTGRTRRQPRRRGRLSPNVPLMVG